MGSGASIPDRIDRQTFEDLAGEVYPAHLFNRYCTGEGILRKDELLQLSKQRDVYFSFDTTPPQLKIFERIQRINDILRSKSVLTYLHDFPNSSSNESHLPTVGLPLKQKSRLLSSPNISNHNLLSPLTSRKSVVEDLQQSICSAIDRSQVVVVCLTRSYLQKVEGSNGNEIAKIEFGYSCRRKGFAKIIPIILEEELVNPSTWTGPVGMALRKHSGIALLNDEQLIDKAEELYQQIVSITTPMLLQSPRSPPSNPAATTASEEVVIPPVSPPEEVLPTTISGPSRAEPTLENQAELAASVSSNKMQIRPRLEVCIECPEYNVLRNWLVTHINLQAEQAHVLANKLISHGLQSPIRLKKKMEMDPGILSSLGFHREEIGTIIHAFAKQRRSSQNLLTAVLDAHGNDDDDDHTTTSVSSSNKADYFFVPNGCLRCSEPMFRLPRGTFNTGWTCDWPTHDGENFFDAEDALYGCGNILKCNVGVCKACYERIQSGKDHYVTISDVSCPACGMGMFLYPKTFVERFGLPWTCTSSYHPAAQNPVSDAEILLYGCASVGSCRHAMCQQCFALEVNRVEEEDEEE